MSRIFIAVARAGRAAEMAVAVGLLMATAVAPAAAQFVASASQCPSGTTAVPLSAGSANNFFCSPDSGNTSGGGSSSSPDLVVVKDKLHPNLLGQIETSQNHDSFRMRMEMSQQAPIINQITANSTYHLGMYLSSPTGTVGPSLDGAVYATHSSGYSSIDSAGILTPGSRSPSYRDVGGGGGLSYTYDAGGLVGQGQRLLFDALFAYDRTSIDYGANSGLATLGLTSTGTVRRDTYNFSGSSFYGFGNSYILGSGTISFGSGTESQAGDGSTGNFSTRGYSTDVQFGHVLTLFGTAVSGNGGSLPIKAAPKPIGGYVVGLDVSAHVGYVNQQIDGFTDSSGFVYGVERTHFGDVGGEVRLFAGISSQTGVLWMPYIAGTVDQRVGFSHRLVIPDQAALAGGDFISFAEANTFGGGRLGLDLRGSSGWTAGIRGFYLASSDTNMVGGNAYVKIPFDLTPTAGARY